MFFVLEDDSKYKAYLNDVVFYINLSKHVYKNYVG